MLVAWFGFTALTAGGVIWGSFATVFRLISVPFLPYLFFLAPAIVWDGFPSLSSMTYFPLTKVQTLYTSIHQLF